MPLKPFIIYVGKGVFVTAFGSIFGNHFLHVANQAQLTGRFNSHLKDALLIFLDEGFWAGDKKAEGVLKSLITEEQIMVEHKFKDAISVKSHLNIMIASNNEWVVSAAFDERRFFVLEISDKRMQDHDYFASLQEQMKNGGIEGMLYHLLNLDISKVNLREVPQTDALFNQKLNTMLAPILFWYERLGAGYWDLVQCGALLHSKRGSYERP